MRTYTKVTHGWVEAIYDENGQCVKQEFVPNPESAPEWRQFEDDEPIEDPQQLKHLELIERYQDFDMVQPPCNDQSDPSDSSTAPLA